MVAILPGQTIIKVIDMNKIQNRDQHTSHSRLSLLFGMLLIAGIAFQGCELLSDDVTVEAIVSVESEQAELGQEISIDGSESTSSDGSSLEYSWSLDTPDGSSAELQNPDNDRTSFVTDVSGDYVVELTVSSGDAQDSDAATISVTSNTLEVSGNINSDETFSSDILYRVVNDLTVSGGAKLTIEPGTRIEFESGTSLQISSDGILSAKGTEQDSIIFTGTESQNGWWQGIMLRETTHPENEMDYVVVEYGGNSSIHGSVAPANLIVGRSLYSASISVNNSTFRNSGGVGLFLHSNGELPNSSSNTFTKNDEAAATGYTNTIHYFDAASSYTGNNGDDIVQIRGNQLSENVTWQAIEVPFEMNGESEIRDSELTINAGAEFSFDAEAQLDIGSGTEIQMLGTEQEPILFTGSVQQAGWWDGIFINQTTHPNNLLEHIIVEYAGGNAFHGSVGQANLVVGRSLYDASVTVKNSTFQHGDGLGLYLHSNGEMPDSEANTYTNNAEGPVSVSTNNIHFLDSNSSFTGNEEGNNYAWVRGNDLSSDATWQPLDVSYGMMGESRVTDSDIVIEPGAEFSFDAESFLQFGSGSQIQVVGTSESPILFTGMTDTPGWWDGIFVTQTTHPDNTFDYVTIEYGGGDSIHSSLEPANLAIGRSLYDASLTVTNSIIRNSGDVGLYIHGNGSTNSDICTVNTFSNNSGADCVEN